MKKILSKINENKRRDIESDRSGKRGHGIKDDREVFTFEQGLVGSEVCTSLREWEQQEQRPQDRGVTGVFETWQGDLWGWSRVS